MGCISFVTKADKKSRASGEMDAQHDTGEATQPQEQIEEETSSPLSLNFKTRKLNAATSKI